MATTKAISSTVQLSLFPCQGTSVKDTQNGSTPVAKLSTYMKTPGALWRMLASYPPTMPVTEAVRRARIDFTKSSNRALHACYQRDARKEVAL